MNLNQNAHIHFIGIGGTGLSAIARVLLERGYTVSGSDMYSSPLAADIEAAGARVFIGHQPSNIQGATLVIQSSAVPPTNPELIAAQTAGIPVLKRSGFLADFMRGQDCYGVAVTFRPGYSPDWEKTLLISSAAFQRIYTITPMPVPALLLSSKRMSTTICFWGWNPH